MLSFFPSLRILNIFIKNSTTQSTAITIKNQLKKKKKNEVEMTRQVMKFLRDVKK